MRLLFIALLVIAAAISLQARPQDQGDNTPRFETYCSRTEPGKSMAEVQWPLAKSGGTTNLDSLVQQQVLDVTTYKDGFERGLYKTVKPGVAQPKFLLFKPPQEAPEIPGLQNLTLAQFGTSQNKPQEGLRMLLRPMPGGQESAAARLEGLEPGMRYFVRVTAPGAAPQTVSFNAPICPVDHVEPNSK